MGDRRLRPARPLWGPRFWQSPWWYRWLTGNFGEDGGFVLSIITARDGAQRVGGVWFTDGEYRPLDHVTIDTTWRTDDQYHEHIRAGSRATRST